MKSRWLVLPLVCVVFAIAVVITFSALNRKAIRAEQQNMIAASLRYPGFTLAQRRAVQQEWMAERHPQWRDVSLAELAHRLLMFAQSSPATTTQPLANFTGNLTSINVPGGDLLGLFRQPNCSLTLDWASYVLSMPTATYTMEGTTPNYDQVLHNAAGLTTNGGNWPAGCGDPIVGVTARKVAYVGMTGSGQIVAADAGFDSATQAEVIYTFVGPLTNSDVNIGIIPISGESPVNLLAANFGGSGLGDVIAVSESATTNGPGSISVIPVDATGTFGTPVDYSLPGQQGLSAVVDDFNGDGKLDIVVTSSTFATGGGTTYSLSYFQGQGNGSFANPQNVTLTPGSSAIGQQYFGLISASLRNNGKKDIVTSAGVVLFGNGDGTFTQSSTAAFPSEGGTSQFGPNVVAGDFNKDGKLDLALDDGNSIGIFLGNGDGTFNPAAGYATIDNTGYLTGTDLDGDGNIDLYSGVMRAGAFGGDQFEINQAYALMGNGDGTFRGAPEMPFVYTGLNLMDLNGDHIPDGVGVNATLNTTNVSMTSYLGASNGIFTAKQTFAISPVTISGTTFQFSSLDSFGLGDVTGSGKAALVYLPEQGFYGPGGVPGYFVAMGNGDGTFATPAFIPAPTFAPTGDFDQSETINDLFVADVNGDGKADLIYSYTAEVFQTGVYEQGIAVQLSNGDGTFAVPQVIQTYSSTTPPTMGAPPFVVQVGHTRAGGPLDLFTETRVLNSTTVTYPLSLYLGKGDGTFAAATTPPVADNIGPPSFGAGLGQVVLADMNGDSKPDLITLGTTNSGGQAELAISLGNGDGTFQTPTIVDFGEGSSLGYGLAAADFDGDGRIDVAVTGFNPPVDAGIFLGNGDGTVQSFSPSSGLVEPSVAIDLVLFGAAQALDFNGDGKPDLVAGQAILFNLGATSTLTPTTTTVTAAPPSPVAPGTSVSFTATVSASGSTPTGSVTFSDGATALGTATLDSTGTATYSTNSLSVGVHTITAAYGGNSTFAASTSPALAFTVTAPAPSFTIAANPTSGSVTAGNSTTTTITVTPTNGFNSAVSFACTGLPAGGTCTTNPTTVTPNGTAAATTVLTIATTTQSGALALPWRPGSRSGGVATVAVLAAGALWVFGRRKRVHWIHLLHPILILLVVAGVALGCGGGSGSSGGGGGGGGGGSKSYTVTITGTAGSQSQSTTFTLTVS